jgi:hypothetical protein
MGVKSRIFEHPEVIGVIAHSVLFHGVVCTYRVFRSLLECVEHKRHFLSSSILNSHPIERDGLRLIFRKV